MLKEFKNKQESAFQVFQDKELVKARDVKDWFKVVRLFYAPTRDGIKLVIEGEENFIFAPTQFTNLVTSVMQEYGLTDVNDVLEEEDTYIKFNVKKTKKNQDFIEVIFK